MPTKRQRPKSEIVAAFASRTDLRLTEDEHRRLEEYVDDVWDMADQLRNVPTPGIEGSEDRLPRRAAYANVRSSASEGSVRPPGPGAEVHRADPRNGADALAQRPLVDVATRLARGEIRSAELVDAVLSRIAAYDGVVRSSTTVDADGAREAARALDAESERDGPRSLLHGIPVGAKDNIPASGMPCTYNSPLTRDWWPARDAECVRRLRAAGAVVVAKHNLNEFGWSIPSEHDLYPPPRNPWMPEEYSVGSSSGSGVAVASRLAFAALGTDGGGSTRLPAGQNGLFGLKPGHGRVPPIGVTEGRISEIGVLARSAEDAAAVFAALLIDPDTAEGAHRLRSEPANRVDQVGRAPRGVRVGIPEGYVADVGMEDDVREAFGATRHACEELEFEIVPLPTDSLSILHDAVRANFVVLAAEHYFDHEEPGKDRSRYGPSAGFYNLPGATLTAADYLHGLRVGDLVRRAVDEVLDDVDLILTPTAPVTRTTTARNPKTHRRGGNAAYTSPFNLSGHAGLSFPAGMNSEGIPIGMQLIGRPDGEFDLLCAGAALSRTFDLPPFPDLERVRELVAGR